MKKVASLLLLAGVAALGLVGCGDDVEVTGPQPEISSVSVTPATIQVEPGQTATVNADVTTQGEVGELSFSWSSGDEGVATVQGNGSSATVTGQASGQVSVTVSVTAANVSGAQTASTGVAVEEIQPADISIASIEEDDGDPIDPSDVSGRILVTVNVEENDQEIDAVQVLFNDQVAAEQTFTSANIAATKTVEAQGEVAQLEFSINTARAAGALDGNPSQAEFENGLKTVTARAQLAETDQAPTAEFNEQLAFDNTDLIVISRFEGGNDAVQDDEGLPYVGGTDVTYAVTPILFSGITVGSITVSSTSDAGPHADIDSDPMNDAEEVTLDETPFRFTIVADQNDGLDGAPAVEDDPDPSEDGHTFSTIEVRDGDNVNVTPSFVRPDGGDRLDFTAPTLADPLAIFNTAFGADFGVPGSDEFWVGTPTNVWDLPNASDDGVGGVTPNVAVTTTAGDTVGTEQSNLGELDESEFDYIGGVVAAEDALGNRAVNDGDVADVGGPNGFAIDKGSPEVEDALPEAGLVLNGEADDDDHNLVFDVSDPDLADNTAGAGPNTAAVLAVRTRPSGVADTVEAFPDVSGGELNYDVFGDFNPPGTGNSSNPDGEYVVTTITDDAANFNAPTLGAVVAAFNVAVHTFEFLMDTSPPSFGALDPSPTSTNTGATSAIKDIGGTISDLSTISQAEITVRADGTDAQGSGSNGTCEPGDYTLSAGAGEVDQNQVDVTNGTNSIDFSESFEISDPFPSGSGTVTYCFFVDAEDSASDNDGTAEHNVGSVQTSADITWTN